MDDRDMRHNQQMSLLAHRDVLSTLPPEAAARLVNANYTLCTYKYLASHIDGLCKNFISQSLIISTVLFVKFRFFCEFYNFLLFHSQLGTYRASRAY